MNAGPGSCAHLHDGVMAHDSAEVFNFAGRNLTLTMKNYLAASLSTILLILMVSMFTACNSDKQDTDPVPTCSDGILNQGEKDVDCGGPCPPCDTITLTAEISGYNWVAKNIDAVASGGKLTITADNAVTPLWQVTLVHDGAFSPGTYPLSSSSKLLQLGGNDYTFSSGSITFTRFDTQNKLVSGTFSAKFNSITYSVNIANGAFTIIPYN